MTAVFGFMQEPDVPRMVARARAAGIRAPAGETSYYLGREQLILTRKGGMARWRKRLFMLMSRNARPATDFFRLPPNRVVELGAQIEF
jgi:KUP system potassium uptake protein